MILRKYWGLFKKLQAEIWHLGMLLQIYLYLVAELPDNENILQK